MMKVVHTGNRGTVGTLDKIDRRGFVYYDKDGSKAFADARAYFLIDSELPEDWLLVEIPDKFWISMFSGQLNSSFARTDLQGLMRKMYDISDEHCIVIVDSSIYNGSSLTDRGVRGIAVSCPKNRVLLEALISEKT